MGKGETEGVGLSGTDADNSSVSEGGGPGGTADCGTREGDVPIEAGREVGMAAVAGEATRAGVTVPDAGFEGGSGRFAIEGMEAGWGLKTIEGGGPVPLVPRDGGPLGGGGVALAARVLSGPAFLFTHFFSSVS